MFKSVQKLGALQTQDFSEGVAIRRNEGFSLALSCKRHEEKTMGRGILLWLLGVPIPVIILLWLFFGH